MTSGKRIGFRFLFVYAVLYLLPFPLNVLPIPNVPALVERIWQAIVPPVARAVFDVEAVFATSGSGDTTYQYVKVFTIAVASLLAALIWTAVDRRERDYARLHAGLHAYVRFALGAAMIIYGVSKVVQSQFPAPSLDRLIQPFGDASPMGLLWTFMGASGPYNVFTGLAEMVGGILLFFPQTSLLGALVSIGVLSNIVMLNFSYDVPVKLFSLHLLAMAVLIAAPDARRLLEFFFRHRIESRRSLLVRVVLVLAFTGWWVYQSNALKSRYGGKSPLYGIWNVEELTIDGIESASGSTDPTGWRRVIFDHPEVLAVQLMNDSRIRYRLALDEKMKTLQLTKRDDPAWKGLLRYERSNPEMMTLSGTAGGKNMQMRLRRTDRKSFLLVNRGFHWVNEYPFNR